MQLSKMSDVQESGGDLKSKSLLAVTVDSITPDGMQFSDFSTASSKVIILLRMTIRHLKYGLKINHPMVRCHS